MDNTGFERGGIHVLVNTEVGTGMHIYIGVCIRMRDVYMRMHVQMDGSIEYGGMSVRVCV